MSFSTFDVPETGRKCQLYSFASFGDISMTMSYRVRYCW